MSEMFKNVVRFFLVCLVLFIYTDVHAHPVAAGNDILDVPYIHQEDDPPDTPNPWDGGHACGAASAVMVVAFWGKLAPHPCDDCGHYEDSVWYASDYAWYVNQTYTNSYGYTFSTTALDDSGYYFSGAFGYAYKDGTTLSNQVIDYFEKHGLVASIECYPGQADVKAQIDAGYPIWASTLLVGGGHIVVIKGYTDTHYIVHDPLQKADKLWTWSQMVVYDRYIITAHPSNDQTWYMSGTASDAGYTMYKADTSQSPSDISIGEGATQTWASEDVAEMDLTFSACDWNVAVSFDSESAPSSGNYFQGRLGTYNTSIGFSQVYSWDWTDAGGGKTYFTKEFNPGEFDVPGGHYLAFQLFNTDDDSDEGLAVQTGSSYSVVITQSSTPAYPVPELPSIILLGTGIGIGLWYLRLKKCLIRGK